MKKLNLFRRSGFLLILLLFLLSFAQSTYALDNTTTVGSQTTDTIDAFYYSDQYFWKVSLFVAKTDTVNRTDSSMSDFYRIGDEAVYLSPVSNWNGWAAGRRPKQISSLLYSKENKVDTLAELESKGGNIAALDPVELTAASGVDIVNASTVVVNDKNLPYPPQMCDGYVWGNSVSYGEYKSSLTDVTNYFSNEKTINYVLNHYATQQGKTPQELVSELEFTINGETRTGWNPEGILPKEITTTKPDGSGVTNPTNQVEWLIVYEPCAIVYTRDDAKWKETDEWYNGYVLSATDFAVTQLTHQMDWRYDESRMQSWLGQQPDAWDANSNREHVARLSHLVVGDSVIIKEGWYHLETTNGIDPNAAIPYNRWTSEAELKYGGWGMSLWEKPITYADSIDYDFNENTDVIYSTEIFSNITTSPGDELTVTYEINGEAYTDTVVAPAKTQVLSYFKWHTPEVDTATSYDLLITVSPFPKGTIGADGNEYVHKTVTVYPLEEQTPPDPKVGDTLPDDFNEDVESNVPEAHVDDGTMEDTDLPLIKSISEVSQSPYYYNDKVVLDIVTNRVTKSIDFRNVATGEIRSLTTDSVGNGILVSTFENKLDDTITWEIEFTMANFGQNTYGILPSSPENGTGVETLYNIEMSEDPDVPIINSVDITPKPEPKANCAEGYYYLFTDTESPDLEYTVYFETFGGTKYDSIKVKSNTLMAQPADPEKVGFVFCGWYKDNNYTELWDFSLPIRCTSTLYAKWEIQKFTVTFDNNGMGNAVPAQQVAYGETVQNPGDLSYEGFDQEGWFKDAELTEEWDFDNDVVTQDTVLYAKWTANEFLVGFDENGGTDVPDQIIKYNEKVTEPTISREGYTFDKWCVDAELTTPWNFDTDTVTSNMVLYAKFIADPSTIYFEENGGSETPDLVGVTDQEITDRTMPEITWEGHTFKGYFLEEDFSGDEVTELPEKFPIGELTYYAKWEINVYTVTFDTDEGSTINEQQVEYQQLATRPEDDPEKEDFYFKNWYADEELTEVFDFDTPITADTTIYARWLGPDDDLSEYTPEQIGEIAEKGEGDDYFDVGDEITIELSTGESVVMQIYGFDHDFKSDGGKTDITFGTKNLLLASNLMNTTADNGDGWDSSALRSWMRNTLYDELPADWQILIYGVDKATSQGGLINNLTVSSDKVYAFSEKELTGNSSNSLSGEGRKYPIFDMGTVIKTQDGSATDYWTRSATIGSESAFAIVESDSSIGSQDADTELGVAFGFSIGTAKQYTLNFDTNGANETVDSQTIDANSLAIDPDMSLSRADGYYFDRWYKDSSCTDEFDFYNDYITADTTLYAGWIEMPAQGTPLEDFTWEQIGIIADQGLGEDYWSVGDEKTDTLLTGEELTFQIYGFNHDAKSDGTADTNITFGLKDLMTDTHCMNPYSYQGNYGGWNASDMRAYLNGSSTTYQAKDYSSSSVFSQLPSEMKLIIEQVDKYTSGGYTNQTIVTSSDKLFLFSEREIGTSLFSISGEGSQYPIFTNAVSRIKYNAAGSADTWWTRTATKDLNGAFSIVNYVGGIGYGGTPGADKVCFGFSVGTSPYSTVTYDSQGGTDVSAVEVENGTTFEAPTEPTKSNYVFGGWFKDADCTESFDFATDSVDQNTTLYAKWQAEVTFDSQGGSAVASQIVDIGGYASQPGSPSRDGYTFVRWSETIDGVDAHVFESETIDQNTTLYAVWDLGVPTADTPLDNWSWEQIEKVANLGLAEDYFVVGEEKTVQINGVSYIFQIYDFNHDELADDSGNLTNITFGTKNAMNDTGQIMDSGTNNGWEYSDLRAWMNNTLISQFPSDVSNIMKQVYKGEYSGADNGNCIVISSDYLFVPSAMEFRGGSPSGYYAGGSKYPIFDDTDNYIKHPGDYAPSNFVWYWSRSSSYYGKYMAYFQNYSSSTTGSWNPNWNFAIVPCFCIGNAPTNTYSVTYNSNGGSAVTTQTVTLNNKATKPADPTKTNAIFDGWYSDAGLTTPWDFNVNTVTANTTLYAKWKALPVPLGGTLESYTWTQIGLIADAGLGDLYFNVGDTKAVLIGSTTYTFQIYGFDMDTKTTGKTKSNITFGMKYLYNTAYASYESSNTNSYAGRTGLRSYLNSSIYSSLPTALQLEIVYVDKYSYSNSDQGGTSTLTYTSDRVFCFSATEVSASTVENGRYPIFTNTESRYKQTQSNTSTNVSWWLRDAYPYATYMYMCVMSDAPSGTNIGYTVPNTPVVPVYLNFGFCI